MGSSCKNLILFAISLLVAALIAEIVIRAVIAPSVAWKYPQETYLHDPEIGHRLVPGQKSFTHDKKVTINSAGIRDAEYPRQAGPGVYRILALGDSQTFGNGLALEDTWPKQLQAELNRKAGGNTYEVLNCGVPGTDNWQHELWLGRMLERYRASGVVLAFYVNDAVPKLHKVIPPQPDVKRSAARDKISYALRQSALVMAVHSAIGAIRLSLWPGQSYLRHEALLRGEEGPKSMQTWQHIEKSLASMKKLSEQHGSDFMVVSLPRRDQIDGRLPAEAYNNKLAAIALRNDVRLIEMLSPLQQSYAEYGSRLFIPWDGHNSAIANRVIAGRMAEVIFESGLDRNRH